MAFIGYQEPPVPVSECSLRFPKSSDRCFADDLSGEGAVAERVWIPSPELSETDDDWQFTVDVPGSLSTRGQDQPE